MALLGFKRKMRNGENMSRTILLYYSCAVSWKFYVWTWE